MTRIVTRVHRPKRPARKRKPVAIKAAIVRKVKPGTANRPEHAQKFFGMNAKPAIVQAGKPERAQKFLRPNVKPAIATSISRKRARLVRAEPAELPDDPDADAALREWLERAKWGHGPAPV